jgi:hypothetical protein
MILRIDAVDQSVHFLHFKPQTGFISKELAVFLRGRPSLSRWRP